MDRSSKMKINKETQALNDSLNKMYLIDIYRTFYPKATDYTFFSSAPWNILQDRSYLGSQIKPCKLNKIEIVSSIFSEHNAVKLGISYRKKSVKKYKHMEDKQYTTK